MKKSWKIFLNDLGNIGTNWVAAILIGGLVFLPSLYAWFNIGASWDPYGRTNQIPVGVVNEDSGTVVRSQEIHVGDELVDTLKKNDSMDWQFVDRSKAMDKLEYGDYFAVIVIPENFSENLGTVINDKPEKAEMEYYVNEKINAVAPKITEKGASVIVGQISSNFISTVNGVIFDMFNEIGIEMEKDLPDIKRFENYVFKMEKNLPEINKLLSKTLTDAESAQEIINKAQGLIPEAKSVSNDGLKTIDDTTAFLNDAENRLNEMAPKIEKDLKYVQEIANDMNEFITEIQDTSIDFSNGDELINQLDQKTTEAVGTIEIIEKSLQQLKEQRPGDSPENEQINQALEQLAVLKTGMKEIQTNSSDLRSFVDEKSNEVNDVLTSLNEVSKITSEGIDAFIKEYKESIEPTVLNEIANAKSTLGRARNILAEIQETIPVVEKILSRTQSNMVEGKGTLEQILDEYPYVNDKVNELADRIREIQGETDIDQIIKLLQNDPEAEKGFFSEPVLLKENKVFPIENYGTGMTPFYTVLAIWVGTLLLISLLATDVNGNESFSGRQVYFGRLYTFVSIGFLQTLIVTSGDMLLMNVAVAHPVWFILFGLLISLVFMLIVYTLVSVFGDVGKAMAIILLVLQIAGSGGTYPVVLLPEFFQFINPFLPFTYAIDLMREAVGGIVWNRVFQDLIFLSLFGLAAVIFGTFLKQTINKQTNKLMKKSKESGLFH
ncbi:phage infection protein [Virgibacillus profundi]|uniref:Phage infection protein n=1 Tax=Virgibacillus profundi TaxID=2024555 RepID=A0A2A2ICK4_9BACI|nr:YhgE/Pip domain-containing protein [Virgibacillus profundi]PAV28875.1 phage infection protein [Virgibacillus profundi]PXY53043.1 YhgE/Pip domain-containing protein [Virgibacillus profundi]